MYRSQPDSSVRVVEWQEVWQDGQAPLVLVEEPGWAGALADPR